MTEKEKLKRKIEEKLSVPQKAIRGDKNKNIEKELGLFLVEKGYIKGVEENSGGWGFVYKSKTKKILVSLNSMPHEKWEDCIFKMGHNDKTKENLFPEPEDETKQYRFLHEANHAYQEYLTDMESPENPKEWHEKALSGELVSVYACLFVFCFQKRMEELSKEKECDYCAKGLSIWGNAPNYDYKSDNSIPNKESEIAVRAQEDANELVTMYMWHPDYFDVYMDYLSLNYDNPEIREKELTREDLDRKNLIRITKMEVDQLREVVILYVQEMKMLIAEK